MWYFSLKYQMSFYNLLLQTGTINKPETEFDTL